MAAQDGGSWLDDFFAALVKSQGTRVARIGGPTGLNLNLLAPMTATANAATGDIDAGMPKATATQDGYMSAADFASLAAATCSANLSNPGSGERLATLYANTTGAARTVTGLRFLPFNSITGNGVNYHKVEVRLLSAPSTVLGSDETSATSWTALEDRTMTVVGAITVPAGDKLLVSLTATGSPAALDLWIGGAVT